MSSWEDAYPSFRARPRTLPDLLRWRAEVSGAATALVGPDGRMSFAEWANRASAIARLLRARGVERRAPVGVWGDNGRACTWASALLGIQWTGAIPVPMNSRMRLPAVAAALQRIDCAHLVLDSNEAVEAGLTAVRFDELPPAAADMLEEPVPERADPSSILHTSGTTGPPKPVVLSHDALAFVGAATEDHILGAYSGIEPLGEGDVLQTSVALNTSSGLLHLLAVAIYSGVRLVVEARFDVASTLETMRREGTKIWFCVPSMMVLLADARPRPVDGIRLQAAWHAGSPVSEGVLAGLRRALPGCACLNLYSLTESGAAIFAATAEDALLRPGTVGLPIPTTEAKILRADGAPVAPGETGCVYLRSPHMLDGYWRDRQVVPAELDGGWMDTGDAGHADAEGHLWVTGRIGDVIIRGGYNIQPTVVEAAILEHDAVADVAVVPVPHRVLGQDLVALVVARAAVDAETMREHCLSRLADYEVPRTMIEVDSLPRNEFGKLDRKQLRVTAEVTVAAPRGAG